MRSGFGAVANDDDAVSRFPVFHFMDLIRSSSAAVCAVANGSQYQPSSEYCLWTIGAISPRDAWELHSLPCARAAGSNDQLVETGWKGIYNIV